MSRPLHCVSGRWPDSLLSHDAGAPQPAKSAVEGSRFGDADFHRRSIPSGKSPRRLMVEGRWRDCY